MIFDDLMNVGSMHFWTMWIGIIAVVALIGWPILKMINIIGTEKFQEAPSFLAVRKYVILLIIGFILSTAMWTAWGSGRELATTPTEEDGAHQVNMAGPDEITEEVKEAQEEEWKAPAQKRMEKKLEEQEDPDEVMRRAVEEATANQPKPEKE